MIDQDTDSKEFHELVTIIISTSPLPSHPSTAVIKAVLNSHKTHCPELVKCKKIVVLDGYKINPQARLKKGSVTQTIADGYEQYRAALKQLLLADAGDSVVLNHAETSRFTMGGRRHLTQVEVKIQKSTDDLVTFIEPDKTLGFAIGVRTALDYAETPYVFIQQHDWAFCATTSLTEIVSGTEATEAFAGHDSLPINYVNFNTRWSLNYSSRQVSHDPSLRFLEKAILKTCEHSTDTQTMRLINKCTPLFYWLDRPHIARTSVYKDQVFGQGRFSAGDFIEDVFGQKMITDIRSQVSTWIPEEGDHLTSSTRARIAQSGWLGCWLWENGEPSSWSLVHLQGRTYMKSTPDMKRRELNIHGGIVSTQQPGK